MRSARVSIAVGVLALAAFAYCAHATPVKASQPARVGRLSVPPALKAKRTGKRTAYSKLTPLVFKNINSRQIITTRLYAMSGEVDESAAEQLDELLCDARDPDHPLSRTMDRRMMQLVFRAAYHFSASHVEVVSAYRKPKSLHEGVHAQGRAIDFRLVGIKSPELAAYLRTIPRVGVGIYTHPKTQFVHLDVRDHSYHWLDASPPRRHWREKNISIKGLNILDAKYSRKDDWPEGVHPPSMAE